MKKENLVSHGVILDANKVHLRVSSKLLFASAVTCNGLTSDNILTYADNTYTERAGA